MYPTIADTDTLYCTLRSVNPSSTFPHVYRGQQDITRDPLDDYSMMRKQENSHDDHDPTTGSSSIALLQERFRQLQKEKEMREGRKLLRLSEGFTGSNRHLEPWQSTTCSQPSVSSFAPHRPMTVHDSVHKELDGPIMQKGYVGDANHARVVKKTWPDDVEDSSSSRDNSDVDTSLHL